ncbi:MAG: pyridoxal-phosphate dependent enzyme [Bdellovibrionota bacterium]
MALTNPYHNVLAFPDGKRLDPLFPEGSILHLVGNTPLVRLRAVGKDLPPGVELWGKCEWMNPSGSVKARPALWMIRDALKSGRLQPGKTILESTSGNTGIALAMIGASLGIPVTLVMPANASEERKAVLKAYGAELILSDPMEGSDGAIILSKEILEKDGGKKYFKPDQYNNPMNPQAHYESTGPEIWKQTGGRVTHFFSSLGTGGTCSGTGRYLREVSGEKVKVLAVEPDSPFHGIEGLKHMASSIVPGTYDAQVHHEKLPAPTDEAYDYCIRIAKEEGLLVGQSSGATVGSAIRYAKKNNIEKGVFVMILCDSAERYLSTAVWADTPDERASRMEAHRKLKDKKA